MATQTLFGAERGWHANEWTATDDRVRGGRSQIHDGAAIFCGHLDFGTLGGAGFASQRTTGDDKHWDLTRSDAIELLVDTTRSDDKQYTFILKDEILPKNPHNGREQSTTAWEYDFNIKDGYTHKNSHLISIVIPYHKLRPTYRGREKDPGHAVNISNIRRLSIMMRSFFGEQQGDFSLCILSITAITTNPTGQVELRPGSSTSSQSSGLQQSKLNTADSDKGRSTSIWTKLFALCHKL